MLPRVTLLSLVFLSACSQRKTNDCEWPAESEPRRLDLARTSDQHHLHDDAERAEDLADRYALSQPGARNARQYSPFYSSCIEKLFTTVAASHGVSTEEVAYFWLRRRTSIDAAVALSFGVFYVLLANAIAREVWRRQGISGWAGVIGIGYASFVMACAGVLLGELWATAIETLRIGNLHLGDRQERIPWSHHYQLEFFVGLVLFCVVAIVQRQLQVQRSAQGAT
jgi:hypothetical protein